MLVLFTDTDTDITPELAREYGYRLISMPYIIEGKIVYPYIDFDKFDSHPYYETLRGGVIPKTSALNDEEYREYFEPVFKNGDDILYVHFSRAMSGTFEAMDRTVAALREQYPERSFYEIDTRAISIGSLNIVEEIGDMYRHGAGIDEILAWADKEIEHFATYFFADDLRFFKQSGRVSNLAGTVGTLLGIRPIIHMNSDGVMLSIGREKGRMNALKRIVDTVVELGYEVEKHRVLVTHSDSPDIAEKAIVMLRERFGDGLNIQLGEVNPTIGAHCGPNAMGICFHSKHR